MNKVSIRFLFSFGILAFVHKLSLYHVTKKRHQVFDQVRYLPGYTAIDNKGWILRLR